MKDSATNNYLRTTDVTAAVPANWDVWCPGYWKKWP